MIKQATTIRICCKQNPIEERKDPYDITAGVQMLPQGILGLITFMLTF